MLTELQKRHRFQRGGPRYDQMCGLIIDGRMCCAVADADIHQMGDIERAEAKATEPQKEFAVGDKVRMLADIWDDGADHHPPGYIAHRGEIVFVRSIEPRTFPVYVSHEGRLDNSFGVELNEIEKVGHD